MPFSSFELHPSLLAGVKSLGYQRPTPIQQEAIPPGIQGRDVLACAMTGSGKTAAFLLPVLHRLLAKGRGTTRALVLSPTRELAAQIDESFRQLAAHTSLKSAAIYGGVSMGPQKRAFESRVDLLVATPGRLLDHFQYSYAKLPGIEILVLDEADRMLDMGFLPDIRRVLAHLPKTERQTLFFSATMPPPIASLTRELLRNPVTVNLQRKAAPATGITQSVFPVREDLKSALLLEMLRRSEVRSALVFTRTKHRANRLADFLAKNGVACDRIHGNRSQAQRTQALAEFKTGRNRVLVATDVAARGIDVEGISHVINLDVPGVPEDYIHRVGRTARAEAVGDAFTFVADHENSDLNAIERVLGSRLPRRTVEGFDYHRKAAEKLEIPLAERLAKMRAEKAEARARAAKKAERRGQAPAPARDRSQRAAPGRGPSPQRTDRQSTGGFRVSMGDRSGGRQRG